MKKKYFFHEYEIIALLGEGGMGAAYLAKEVLGTGAARNVVLKTALPGRDRDRDNARAMLLDDGILAAVARDSEQNDLGRDNIVTIHRIFRDEFVIAMEYIPGRSLSDIFWQFSQRPSGKNRMPEDVAACLISQACRGFHRVHTAIDQYGHPMGVVHRDVKPGNLMCSQSGIIKIIDFGIATARYRNAQPSLPNELKGTMIYMAPERLPGRGAITNPASPASSVSDMFALGTILYELLSGDRLFKRDNPRAEFFAVRDHQYNPIGHISSELNELLGRVLSNEPGERPPAIEFASALEAIVRGHNHGTALSSLECVQRLAHIGIDLSPRQISPMKDVPVIDNLVEYAADDTIVDVPALGIVGRHEVAPGNEIFLYSFCTQSVTLVPLAISLPEVLPYEIEVAATSHFAEIKLPSSHNSKDTPYAIYLDAQDPRTKNPSLQIAPWAPDGRFDIGHRDHAVTTVFFDSTSCNNKNAKPRLQLRICKVGVTIVGASGVRQLITLRVTKGKKTHVICISIA